MLDFIIAHSLIQNMYFNILYLPSKRTSPRRHGQYIMTQKTRIAHKVSPRFQCIQQATITNQENWKVQGRHLLEVIWRPQLRVPGRTPHGAMSTNHRIRMTCHRWQVPGKGTTRQIEMSCDQYFSSNRYLQMIVIAKQWCTIFTLCIWSVNFTCLHSSHMVYERHIPPIMGLSHRVNERHMPPIMGLSLYPRPTWTMTLVTHG